MKTTDGIVEAIDNKIAELQDIRRRVIAAFGARNGSASGAKRATTNRKPLAKAGEKSRKDQLSEFLKAHGPLALGEIKKRADIPEGTISYCLGDKKLFTQNEDGKWLAK